MGSQGKALSRAVVLARNYVFSLETLSSEPLFEKRGSDTSPKTLLKRKKQTHFRKGFWIPKNFIKKKRINFFRKVLLELFQKLAGFLRAAPLSRAGVVARNCQATRSVGFTSQTTCRAT